MSKLSDFTETTPTVNDFLEDTVDTDEIVIGGTVTHIFELPFIYSEIVKSARVIYKQALETKLTVPVLDSMVHIVGHKSVIYVYLPKVHTELFDDTVLDTYCQLEIITKNNEVLYDNPHKINVIAPLETSPAPVSVITDVAVNGSSVVYGGVANVNIKSINGESITGEGNLEIHDILTNDFSGDILLILSAQEFSELTHNHYAIIGEEFLNIADNIWDYEAVYVKVALGGTAYKVRLLKNNDSNMNGTLVVKNGESIYDILISLLKADGETKAVIRCASIY